MEEIWKDIKNYEGLYQVSNLGRIRSLDRIVVLKGKILKTPKNSFGYQVLKLSKNGKNKQVSVHKVVAETFIPNPQNYPNVLHKKAIVDGGTNSVDNLYWGTQSQNLRDCIKDGHWKIPNIINKRHRKIKQYDLDNNFIKEWYSIKDASEELNINYAGICGCLKGKQKTSGGYIWKYSKE